MEMTKDSFREAGEQFSAAAGLCFGDAMQRRLRYHLLRLTTVGLSHTEVEDLVELGRLAIQGSKVEEQATRIKQQASPLAFVIADIVARAESDARPVNMRAVMLGAVLGAHTSLSGVPEEDKLSAAALGAVGGAVAMSTGTFIAENIERQSWSDYVQTND
jgi:hypothetical protein